MIWFLLMKLVTSPSSHWVARTRSTRFHYSLRSMVKSRPFSVLKIQTNINSVSLKIRRRVEIEKFVCSMRNSLPATVRLNVLEKLHQSSLSLPFKLTSQEASAPTSSSTQNSLSFHLACSSLTSLSKTDWSSYQIKKNHVAKERSLKDPHSSIVIFCKDHFFWKKINGENNISLCLSLMPCRLMWRSWQIPTILSFLFGLLTEQDVLKIVLERTKIKYQLNCLKLNKTSDKTSAMVSWK